MTAFRATAAALVLIATLSVVTIANAANRHPLELTYKADGNVAHKLDLYLPSGVNRAPLLVFVHGGSMMVSTRKDYVDIGEMLSAQKLAVAIVDYRNYPETNAQGVIQDVADAVAWLSLHGEQYNYDASRISLAGHSSGAQIVSVLATNMTFLHNAHAERSVLRGVFAVSGAFDVRILLGSDREKAVDGHIYGETVERRAEVSAVANATEPTVPIVAACGLGEVRYTCDQAEALARALLAVHSKVTVLRVAGVDHFMILRALYTPHHPLNTALHDMIDSP